MTITRFAIAVVIGAVVGYLIGSGVIKYHGQRIVVPPVGKNGRRIATAISVLLLVLAFMAMTDTGIG